MGRKVSAVLCAFALSLGAAACGDDDSDDGGGSGGGTSTAAPATTEPETATLTKDEWIQQADAICERAEADAEALEPQSEDPKVIAEAIRGLEPLFAKQREDLAALGAPDEIKSQVDEALGLLEQQAAILPQVATAVENNDEQAAQQASQAGDQLDDRLDAIAKEIGLQECGGE